MEYVNLTPHAVTVYNGDEAVLTVPPSGTVARVAETATPVHRAADGTQRVHVQLGEVVGLPPMLGNSTYIGSMPLLMAMAAAGIHRDDVVYPYGQVRDSAGRIIGCRSLARIA